MKRLVWTLIFAAIFLLGLAMRSPEILAGNYLFGFDQGQNYMKAYDIAVNHKFTLIGAEVGSGSAGVPGLFHGPGYYYLLALMILLFHGDPYGGLVLMWVGGVATLILAFLTTRKMFGEKTALVVLFLVAIAPLIAPQSRFLWGPHLASLFIVLCFYFLYRIPDNPVIFTFWTVFTAGLLYNFELALSVPLVLLSFISLFVYRVFHKKVIATALIAAAIAFAPMIVFEARHGFMATKGIVKNITTKKQIDPKDKEAKRQGSFYLDEKKYQFIANFRDSFVFEFGKIPPDWYDRTLMAVAAVIALGLVASRDRRAKKFILLLLLAIPISFLVFLPLRGAIWPYYLIHLHFVYLYAFAFATVQIAGVLPREVIPSILAIHRALTGVSSTHLTAHPPASKSKASRSIRGSLRVAGNPLRVSPLLVVRTFVYVGAFVFILFFFLSMSQGVIPRLKLNWMVDYSDYGGKDKIRGKRAVIDYIYADAKGKPFSVFVFMPPVYTWPYDYLFLTYAKEKYGYMPSTEKKGTAYMIIEQDGTKPWSYKGWLETVIKAGTPVWERYLWPSDHIVQKRVF